jgi:lipoate-protein ligase A
VVVGPEECLWVDLVVPAGDPLWDEDVGRAMWWVGEAWATALTGVGVPAPSVWRGSFQGNEWSGRVCFAGMGPGEVMVGPGKVVGVSQRRTRQGSLFQTAALLKWQPADLAGLLNVDPQSRERAAAELGHRAMGLGPELAEPLWAALVDVLDSGRPPRS